MSQDQPKQPPEKPKSQVPGSKPEVGQSRSALQQLNHTLRQAWSRAQPVLRSQSIKVLRATIQVLEAVLTKLEAPPKTTSTEESKPVQSNATAASSESQAAPVTPSDPASGTPDQSTPVTSFKSVQDKFRPRLEQLQTWWNAILGKVRSWLPESTNQKLSDTALSGAIAGILVILLWTTSALFSGKPSPKIANVPPPQRIPAPDLTAPPELRVLEKPQPVEVSPPPPAGPVVTPSPMMLSPEQQGIADIQTQITEVGNQYANCLIQLVQTNFQAGHLTAKTSNSWYNLSSSQQDKLADELLKRAQKSNFNQLEIVDVQGTLLARSPVVGDNMVILQRQIASPELTTS